MNVELLNQVKQAILANPQNTDMWVNWIEGTTYDKPCATVGCIAGWTIAHGNLQEMSEKIEFDINRCEENATRMLRLSGDQARRLFFVHHWPEKFQNKYNSVVGCDRDRANVIATRIEHFIATEGEE